MPPAKRFDEWIKVKSSRHNTGRTPAIHEGEVWWCAVGENVGVEINGRNQSFSRPVIILKKLSCFSFMGIPLSSQPHGSSWYIPFIFQDKQQVAILAQARVMSTSRLYQKMGQLPESDLELVKQGFSRLYSSQK